MRSLNRWFRKNAKYGMAGIIVLIMVSWGITPMLRSKNPDPVFGKIAGETVRELDMRSMVRRWNVVLYRGRRRRDQAFYEEMWKQLIRVKAAERMGLEVSDAEIDKSLAAGGMFAGIAQGLAPAMIGAPLRLTIREVLLLQKLNEVMTKSVHVTAREAWYAFAQQNERVKIRYAVVPAQAFKPLVTVTDEALRKFYEQYKDTPKPHTDDKVGYLEPEKVQIEYVLARAEDFRKDIKITEDQIKEYYEKHKDYDYAVREPEAAKTTTVAPKGDAKAGKAQTGTAAPAAQQKPSETKKASVASGGPDAAAATKTVAATTTTAAAATTTAAAKPAKPKFTYRPLKEVRDEIKDILMGKAADKKVTDAINKADEAIGEAMQADSALSFEALAKKQGLVYVKTDFFSRDEAEDILPGATELAKRAFSSNTFLKYPEAPLPCLDGKFIFQLLARREPVPAPFKEVKDRVAKDYVRAKALEIARVRAEEGKKLIAKLGFDKGADALNAKLAAELPKPAPAKDKPKTGADKPKEKPPVVRHGETGFFGRPQTFGEMTMCFIPELEGDRPKVGELAFQLDVGKLGVAVEETGERACYIIQVIERKSADPQEFGAQKKQVMKRLLKEKRSRLLKAYGEALEKDAKLLRGFH